VVADAPHFLWWGQLQLGTCRSETKAEGGPEDVLSLRVSAAAEDAANEGGGGHCFLIVVAPGKLFRSHSAAGKYVSGGHALI